MQRMIHYDKAMNHMYHEGMEQRYSETIRRLIDSFPALTPQLRQAARYMVENPEEVGLNSMRSVARKAGVKPATISRLSKALGFAAYDELREPFRDRLRIREPEFASRMQDVQRRGADDYVGLFAELKEQELDNVQRSLSAENRIVVDAVAETLLDSRRVFVLGLRGAYAVAFLFHYAYRLFRENSVLLDTHAGTFADHLRGIQQHDSMLVVSFPPYTQLTIDAAQYAADSGARIVAVTDSAMSPVASTARHTLIAHNRSASFYHSFTGALAVTQALITLIVAKTGGDAVKIAEEAERQLSRISAYW